MKITRYTLKEIINNFLLEKDMSDEFSREYQRYKPAEIQRKRKAAGIPTATKSIMSALEQHIKNPTLKKFIVNYVLGPKGSPDDLFENETKRKFELFNYVRLGYRIYVRI